MPVGVRRTTSIRGLKLRTVFIPGKGYLRLVCSPQDPIATHSYAQVLRPGHQVERALDILRVRHTSPKQALRKRAQQAQRKRAQSKRAQRKQAQRKRAQSKRAQSKRAQSKRAQQDQGKRAKQVKLMTTGECANDASTPCILLNACI